MGKDRTVFKRGSPIQDVNHRNMQIIWGYFPSFHGSIPGKKFVNPSLLMGALLQGFQKLVQLPFRKNLFGCVVHLGNDRTFGGISGDQMLPHCSVHRLVEHHENTAYHAVGQGICFLYGMRYQATEQKYYSTSCNAA